MPWLAPGQAKVVAAAIIIALAVGYFIGLWSLLGEWLSALWHLLAGETLVPNWLVGIFAICSLIVAGLLGASLRPTRRRLERPYQIHAQDNFFNIKWRWSYDEGGSVRQLTPYCRHCDHLLVLKNVGAGRPIDRYECRCEHCGALACELDCSIEEFERRVLVRIDQAG
jgi:hypothetical protein